jgi:hypothetical protein
MNSTRRSKVRFLILFIFLSVSLVYSGEYSFTASSSNSKQTTEAGETVHFKVSLVNNSSQDLVFTLKSKTVSNPMEWMTMICQGGVCSQVEEVDTQAVPAGGSLELEFSVITEARGKGTFRFQVFPKDMPTMIKSFTYTVTAK